eukprot:gene9310-16443_t
MRGPVDFTCDGAVMVVANALLCSSASLQQAYHILPTLNSGDNTAVLNASLYSAAVLMQSTMDAVDSVCNKLADNPIQGNIYFHSYAFKHTETRWVAQVQKELPHPLYRGMSFYDFANKLKHEQPWVGQVGKWINEEDKLIGKYDGVLGIYDTDGTCFLYGILIPVYKYLVAVCSRLCKQCHVPIPVYPSF